MRMAVRRNLRLNRRFSRHGWSVSSSRALHHLTRARSARNSTRTTNHGNQARTPHPRHRDIKRKRLQRKIIQTRAITPRHLHRDRYFLALRSGGGVSECPGAEGEDVAVGVGDVRYGLFAYGWDVEEAVQQIGGEESCRLAVCKIKAPGAEGAEWQSADIRQLTNHGFHCCVGAAVVPVPAILRSTVPIRVIAAENNAVAVGGRHLFHPANNRGGWATAEILAEDWGGVAVDEDMLLSMSRQHDRLIKRKLQLMAFRSITALMDCKI